VVDGHRWATGVFVTQKAQRITGEAALVRTPLSIQFATSNVLRVQRPGTIAPTEEPPMRSPAKTALVGTLGVLAGAAAMGIVHAQSASVDTPAYVIANAEAVMDSAMLSKYGAAVGKTISAFGGRIIVRGSPAVKLDASQLPKGVFVVVQFPSMKALQDWWHSPEYSAIRPYREQSTDSHAFALEGVPTP
jgi:uncharacterized protein (DUF1330 family)